MRPRWGFQVAAAAVATGLALACQVEGEPQVDGEPQRVETLPDTAEPGIPFRLIGPDETALVVPVHLNGEGPFDFVLDTGATFTCIESDVVARLGLDPVPGARGFGAGISGGGRVEIVRVDSLRIGHVLAHDLLACSLDLSRLRAVGTDVNGLVGLNMLKQFRVTLDFESETLLLEKP